MERAAAAEPLPAGDRAAAEGGGPGDPVRPGPAGDPPPGQPGPRGRRPPLLRPGPPGPRLPRDRGLRAQPVARRGIPIRPSAGGGDCGTIEGMTDNTPAPQVWPTLRATDARKLIAFLVEAFGFEETA